MQKVVTCIKYPSEENIITYLYVLLELYCYTKKITKSYDEYFFMILKNRF